jgi:replicative DNA helicase
MNIEKELISIIFHNPQLIEKVRNYMYIFKDKKCKKVIEKIVNENKTTEQLLLKSLRSDIGIETSEILDIISNDFLANNFQMYFDELYKDWIIDKLQEYVIRIGSNTKIKYTEIQQELKNIYKNIQVDNYDIKNCQDECWKMIEDIKADRKIDRVYSGVDFLDDYQLGYEPGDYVIIAAGEGVGKTSYILHLMLKQLRNNLNIGFFTCEMRRSKIIRLLACNIAGIDSNKIDTNTLNKIEKEKYLKATEKIYEFPLFVIDSNRSIYNILKNIRILKQKYGVQCIYIDYLQYLRTIKRMQMYDRLEEISTGIREISKELQIPIVMISQVSREGKKEDKLSTHHIKGNGDIEYDADIIILINKKQKAIDGDFSKCILGFNIAKNRNGKIGKYDLLFIKPIRRFENAKLI